MNKINLVLLEDDWTSFTSSYLESLFKEYFNYSIYNNDITYNKKSTLFIVSDRVDQQLLLTIKDKGYKIAIDNLWNGPLVRDRPSRLGYYQISNLNWFWYNDCMWYKSLGYNTYVPHKTYNKIALMPLSRIKYERKLLIDGLENLLDEFIYSYGTARLPDDFSDLTNASHYFNPKWYDDTYFSIVAETNVMHLDPYILLTEKTFKPMAFYHPLLLVAQPNALGYLKSLGFETFNNIFDESYDTENNNHLRINKVIEQVKNFNKQPYDKLTIEKLTHNHNLFFDFKQVNTRIINEIIEPILEYAET
jgi:hypothetical protein